MIHVVGGTYLEQCREQRWCELFGSGLRASLALAEIQRNVQFSTFIGGRQRGVLLAKSAKIQVHAIEAPQTVIFDYVHALARPDIRPDDYARGDGALRQSIDVKSDKVLRFGMVEGSAKVSARMATYDPQSPTAPVNFEENGSKADRLAVVANRHEAERLTGKALATDACKAILKNGAEVAVVKCGAHGCVVATSKGISTVPAYRTKKVWPIGSGDVFSALFANGWMEVGMSPKDAADRASRGTSHFVETVLFPSRRDLGRKGFVPLKQLPVRKHKKVYLAGPFFNFAQRWLIEEFRSALRQANLKVFSPFHDVGRGEAQLIYDPDIKGLRESGVVLACLDGLDPGTLYEIGYAHSLGLKVIAFVSGEHPEALKIGGNSTRRTMLFVSALDNKGVILMTTSLVTASPKIWLKSNAPVSTRALSPFLFKRFGNRSHWPERQRQGTLRVASE